MQNVSGVNDIKELVEDRKPENSRNVLVRFLEFWVLRSHGLRSKPQRGDISVASAVSATYRAAAISRPYRALPSFGP